MLLLVLQSSNSWDKKSELHLLGMLPWLLGVIDVLVKIFVKEHWLPSFPHFHVLVIEHIEDWKSAEVVDGLEKLTQAMEAQGGLFEYCLG